MCTFISVQNNSKEPVVYIIADAVSGKCAAERRSASCEPILKLMRTGAGPGGGGALNYIAVHTCDQKNA